MKLVTAIRHAKSSWSNPGLADTDRPLNDRGKRAAPAMAEHLHRMDHRPDLMISSPARRAHDTALLFAKGLGYPETDIAIDKRLYFEGAMAIVEMLREQSDSFQHVFFFSHEPVISGFCEHLGGNTGWKFSTAAACALRFDIDSWADFGREGRQLFFIKPKELKQRDS